jgi:hypothetical protein
MAMCDTAGNDDDYLHNQYDDNNYDDNYDVDHHHDDNINYDDDDYHYNDNDHHHYNDYRTSNSIEHCRNGRSSDDRRIFTQYGH